MEDLKSGVVDLASARIRYEELDATAMNAFPELERVQEANLLSIMTADQKASLQTFREQKLKEATSEYAEQGLIHPMRELLSGSPMNASQIVAVSRTIESFYARNPRRLGLWPGNFYTDWNSLWDDVSVREDLRRTLTADQVSILEGRLK